MCAKLPSGYQRDLQLLKARCSAASMSPPPTLAILPPAIDALRFRPERIRLDPAIHAAEEANRAGGRARASRSARPTGAWRRSSRDSALLRVAAARRVRQAPPTRRIS